ncbi:MAG: hypothetical protein Salg2KO_21270 [Salibacteraceae bacterium]
MSAHLSNGSDLTPAILVSNITMIEGCISQISEGAYQFMEFSEGPIDLLFPGARNVPAALAQKNGTTLFRYVKEGYLHDLISAMRQPLVAVTLEGNDERLQNVIGNIESDLTILHEAIPSWPDRAIQFNADHTFKLLKRA